jgi:hypothetical protein
MTSVRPYMFPGICIPKQFDRYELVNLVKLDVRSL